MTEETPNKTEQVLEETQEKKKRKKRILIGSIVTSCIIAALIPILISWYGGGAYLRAMWLFVIPIIIFFAGLILLIHYTILKAMLVYRKQDPAEIAWGKSKTIALTLAVTFVFIGWYLGVQIRQFRCRLIGKSCEPIFAALDGYKKEHGTYPEKLKDIAGIDNIIKKAGITVTEGKGSSVPELSEAQVTFYLEPDRYVSVVPIEHKLFMSITRFYVYIRDSESDEWKKDHIVWFLMSVD